MFDYLFSIRGKKTNTYIDLESHGYRLAKERYSISLFYRFPLENTIKESYFLGDDKCKYELKDSFHRIRNLREDRHVDFYYIKPNRLLVHSRFDIAIKCIYAKLYLKGRAKEWREYAYELHLNYITGRNNHIREYAGSTILKDGAVEFIDEFNSLLSETETEKRSNYPTVPIDKYYCAFDGAHRIASSILLNKNLKVAQIDDVSHSIANYEFFKRKACASNSFDENVLDQAAIEYCNYKDGLIIALIFPTVKNKKTGLEIIKEYGNIVYQKDIFCSLSTASSLLRQVYLGHDWAELSNSDAGFENKINACFPFPGYLKVVVIDNVIPRKIRELKNKIRDVYQLGNHSVHFTDGDDELIRLARIVFNNNSIRLLDMINVKFFEDFHEKLFKYRDWLESNSLDEDDFCIDGSAILSLFGIRKCNDIDFIYDGNIELLPNMPRKIDCHNHMESYFPNKISDVIGDPRLHFWYMGVKFCIPEFVLAMKKNRNERKDKLDYARLIDILLKNRKLTTKINIIKLNVIGKIRASVFFLKKLIRPFYHYCKRIK